MSWRLRFDKEKCVGCFACHTACLDAHYEVTEEQAHSRRTIQKYRKDEWEKNICPGCIHCGACLRACPEGAIYREEKTGFALNDKSKCTGCRMCEAVCPMKVIHFDEEGRMEKCDGCIERLKEGREPACVRVCALGAITLEEG